MIVRKIILKTFMQTGFYSRVAVLTRGVELYAGRYEIEEGPYLNTVVDLFWEFCAGRHNSGKWEESLNEACEALNSPDDVLMLLINDILDLIRLQIGSQPSLETDRTEAFDFFFSPLRILYYKGIVIWDLDKILEFSRLSLWRKAILGPSWAYYAGKPFSRKEIVPFISYRLWPELSGRGGISPSGPISQEH